MLAQVVIKNQPATNILPCFCDRGVGEVDPENWTDFGMELRCDIASRMVKNQGDINGELTKET
jgi:hypothetical protein